MPKNIQRNIYDNTIDSVANGLKSYLTCLRRATGVKTGLTQYDKEKKDYYWNIVIVDGNEEYTFRLTQDYLRHTSFTNILLDIVSAYTEERKI